MKSYTMNLKRESFITSDTARLANELEALGSTRTEALNEARRLVMKYGTGFSIGSRVDEIKTETECTE